MKKISFDFDETLEFKEVQDYAKELIERGFEVWIVTTRWEDPSKYSFHVTHENIWKAIEYTGIKKEHIHFNNMEYKHSFFEKNNDFIFHLDDNPDEKRLMSQNTTVPCVVFGYRWKDKCEVILKGS